MEEKAGKNFPSLKTFAPANVSCAYDNWEFKYDPNCTQGLGTRNAKESIWESAWQGKCPVH